ncbi:hypothetical protein HOE22_05015 [Candidatus Woesearchaeota archaeon]|jgi:hypothetical protein|nr:hypothetical protein [Candidatus Woesearchaeota archaeon]MBT4732555.1 hypothetical protein [Candidatus Woesearchaeota archaeon]MBT7556409.1 hypothetical protein [Candidatus Woesearchaeota archaeon]|tara:strand:+ start:288 stop:479 length:192 start_codon:yes stop_codon:yes gene_type:complete
MDYKLTSVKVLKELYRKFKSSNLDDEFTLQKLVNRSMDLYLLDKKFNNQIKNWQNLKQSGSRL